MAANKRPQTFDVYVGNLPPESNEKNVGKLFTPFGEIGGILVKESNKSKGPNNKFAFVKFLCEPDADRAVKEMDHQKIQGTDIVLSVKKAGDRNKPDDRKKFQNDQQGWKGKFSDTDSNDGSLVGGFQGGGGGSNIETYKEVETAMVTFVENPITMWVQIVNDDNTKKIFNITEQLASLCPAAKRVTGQPEPGKVYACLFTEDNMWYRCHIKQSLGTDRYKIQYIDYGNTEEVSVDSLVEIPPSVANMKQLAMKVMLHNIRAKDLTDKQAIEFLKSITDNQMTQLTKVRSLADGSGYYSTLSVNNQSVSEAMVTAGHCHNRPAFGKLGGPQGKLGPNDMGDAPGPGMMGNSMFTNKAGMPQHREGSMNMPILSQPPPPLMGYMPQGGSDKDRQMEFSKMRRDLEKAKNEKDSVNLQLEYMRTKVKTLQDEFAASAAKLQEDTLSKRSMTLMSLAAVVRRLRAQFPTSQNTACLLEEAINLCTASDRVDNSSCTTLGEVATALNRYKAAQNEISQCHDKAEIEELVGARNEARRELHNKLNLCLEEFKTLPLETRTNKVKEFQEKLSSTYSEYLQFQLTDCPSLQNLMAGFKTWKSKKDSEFSDVRTATDYCEEALQTALSQVKQRVSVHCTEVCEKSEVDVDELMKTYAHALQREVNVTDQVHSKDASLVATVVKAVSNELEREMGCLDNLHTLEREFESRQQIIEPWLDAEPKFEDMQENRKTLRSLKSKMRHTLADKIDVEESGSKEELLAIQEDVERLREELQGVLLKSDNLMGDVASLAESNFPELIVQYPDLGLDKYLLYKGLVKSNREIDHYCLNPGFRPGVHISQFNGETVLIQEFHIGDSDHCSKEDFLRQIVQYNGDTKDIQAVFFTKNERQAYTQCHWEDSESLELCIKSAKFTRRELQDITRQLVNLVTGLNKRGFVHGEINPTNVFCRQENVMYLLAPDFSKPVVSNVRAPDKTDRVSKRYVTEKGLVFQTPELQYTSPEILGASTDVYNLVLLLFMLHCPDGSLPSPRTTGSDLDPSLKKLFEGFMTGKNLSHITAENLLQLDYFSRTIRDTPSPVQAPPMPSLTPPMPSLTPLVPSLTPPPPMIVDSVPQIPVIKSTQEPMEIGVFRAEDYMSAPILDPVASVNSVDTDDSWTTKSTSSASSGSRVDSPLEITLEAKCDELASEKLQTVIEADCNSGDTTLFSGNSSEFGGESVSSSDILEVSNRLAKESLASNTVQQSQTEQTQSKPDNDDGQVSGQADCPVSITDQGTSEGESRDTIAVSQTEEASLQVKDTETTPTPPTTPTGETEGPTDGQNNDC